MLIKKNMRSRFQKNQPTQIDVHVNRPLGDYATAYMQDEKDFIAERAAPGYKSDKKSDSYYIFDKGDMQRDEAAERAPGDESVGGGFGLTTASFRAKRYSYHKDVAYEEIQNADQAVNLDMAATRVVARKGLIRREVQVAGTMFITGVWTGATEITGVDAGPAANQFLRWNKSGSTPFQDMSSRIVTTKRNTGFRPNRCICGANVWQVLQNHADIVDRIKHTQAKAATRELMASLLEIDEFMVAEAVKNTAKKGQTASNSFIWDPDSILFYYVNPAAGSDLMQPNSVTSFNWTGMFGANATGGRIRRIEIPERDSARIEIDLAFDIKVVGADLGCFLLTAVTPGLLG